MVAGKLDAFAGRGDGVSRNIASARFYNTWSQTTFKCLKYTIDGVEMCKAVFAHIHKVSEHTLKMQTRLKHGATTLPTHFHAGRLPRNIRLVKCLK